MNFDAVKDLRVLMIGDAIRDRYVFARPLGKAMKESVLSVAYEREEVYDGGIWAAAEHARQVCRMVDVMHGERVMLSSRWMEGSRKLWVEHREQVEIGGGGRVRDIASYDLVVVIDYGYGTMTPKLIERVTSEARFLAVNAQTNSSNIGFNLITKYPRADYVVIDRGEAQLAAHDRESSIEGVIAKLPYERIVVTLGSEGAVGFERGTFHREPARADRVVDTMGAGDAFLAVSAPFAAARASIRELVEIGNRAGAAKVGVLGHRRAIRREDLQ